ncbi:MAG: rhamnogalacturonan lyase [Lachnospiraceae bacterium]|nr:rhamnogalacturonan lyase [Lachnospiraceae bacterium]
MTIAIAGAISAAVSYGFNSNFGKSKASDATWQAEYLTRGVVAVNTNSGVLVSWRLLGTEDYGTTFNVYKNGKKIAEKISNSTNYTDKSGTAGDSYYVTAVNSGTEGNASDKATAWASNYLDININKPADGSNKSGSYSYTANDASVGDVDGDGEYEIILKWDPTNSKDNSQSGYTGNVYLDCYRMNGKQLWRIDLGCNIRAGAHYSPYLVYDFDGNGKAEVVVRTAYGSKDGKGNYVNASSDGLNSKDYRNSKGYVLEGKEFLSIFNGETGATIQSIEYNPQRGTVKSWGDSYGNRVDRFLAGVAYLDGKTPSIIMCRGYYTRAVIVAYSFNGSKLNQQWCYDTGSSTSATDSAYGQGAHSLSVADVDNDGYDEIVYGSAVIDNNGKLLYSTGHGHGDALHVSDFNNDGKQEIYMVHETSYAKYGAELRDGKTGKVLAAVGASGDVGRGLMANVTSASGAEFWSTGDSNLYNTSGKNIGSRPSSVNFSIFWDGDLLSELLDKTSVSKYNESTGRTDTMFTFTNVHSNNSTKATPCLSADLFGDFREEVIMAGDNDTFLRIYTTNIETTNKLYTFMHDRQYRTAIAWQNAGYNQPPHTSYYIGTDMKKGTQPKIYYPTMPAVTSKPAATTSPVTSKPAATTTPAVTTQAPQTTTEPSTAVTYGWNFKTSKFRSLGTVTETKTIDNLTINATKDKSVSIAEDKATIGGTELTYSLKLGGSGNANYRSVKIPVAKNQTIKIMFRSNDTSKERSLAIADSSMKELTRMSATTATCQTYKYTGEDGYVYIYSANSGINIYKIEVIN